MYLGALQPEVVRDSVTKGLLVEEISFDFQSRCLYSEDFLSVRENNSTLLDDSRHFATYENEYSCLQLVRNFYINSTLLGSLNGTFSGEFILTLLIQIYFGYTIRHNI